jgi:hypothetical protein
VLEWIILSVKKLANSSQFEMMIGVTYSALSAFADKALFN